MTHSRLISLAGCAVLLVFLWAFLLPPAVGGRTTIITTRGISMEPYLHQGDSTILRKASTYDVGDVIAFNDKVIRATSMHRIIEVTPDGRYITKGDNNNFIDIYHPGDGDVLGRVVYKLEGAEGAAKTLTAWPIRLLGLGLVIWALFGMFSGPVAGTARRARGRASDIAPLKSATKVAGESVTKARQQGSGVASGFGIVAVLLLVASIFLTVIGFAQPAKAETDRRIFYTFYGEFDYSGWGAPGSENIYNDRQVTTGEPVFLSLVDGLLMSYRFRLESPGKFKGTATYSDRITITGKSGWTHTVHQSSPLQFTGTEFRTSNALNLPELKAKAAEISALTRSSEQGYMIEIAPEVRLKGELSGSPFTETFANKLTLDVNDVALRAQAAPPISTGPGEESKNQAVLTGLTPKGGGDLKVEASAPTRIKAFGRSVGLAALRTIGVTGALVAVLMLALLWLNGRRMRRRAVVDVHDEAVRQYQQLFVPITAIGSGEDRTIDLASLDQLARLAETYETFIFEQHSEDGVVYFCEHGSSRYRYVHQSGGAKQRFGVTERAAAKQR